jgi:hypothetical protein
MGKSARNVDATFSATEYPHHVGNPRMKRRHVDRNTNRNANRNAAKSIIIQVRQRTCPPWRDARRVAKRFTAMQASSVNDETWFLGKEGAARRADRLA